MGIQGIQNKHIKQLTKNNQTLTVQSIPLKKVGESCEGADGDISLPIEYNDVKTLEILNNGARKTIATKHVWEQWGRSAI